MLAQNIRTGNRPGKAIPSINDPVAKKLKLTTGPYPIRDLLKAGGDLTMLLSKLGDSTINALVSYYDKKLPLEPKYQGCEFKLRNSAVIITKLLPKENRLLFTYKDPELTTSLVIDLDLAGQPRSIGSINDKKNIFWPNFLKTTNALYLHSLLKRSY
jgi:hypothetical protein